MAVTPHDVTIGAVAAEYALDTELLIAQVLVESNGHADAFRYEPAFYARYIRGNPQARGRRFGPLAACSYGLLQVLLETACEYGYDGQPHGLFDPTIGLEYGCKVIRRLLDQYGGDVERALCAYNGGPGAVLERPYRTQAYADKVFHERRVRFPRTDV